jgi:hypothetical protein
MAETIKEDEAMYRRLQWGAAINLNLPREWHFFGDNRLAADFLVGKDFFTLCVERRDDGTHHVAGLFEHMPAAYYVGRYKAHDPEFIGIAEKLLRELVLGTRKHLLDHEHTDEEQECEDA